MFSEIMYHINIFKSSSTQKDFPKPTDPITVVPANRRAPPLDGGQSTKVGGVLNLNHEIRSPRFYGLLFKIELKGDTALDLKNFYKHINMCINAVTRIQEDLISCYIHQRTICFFRIHHTGS